MIRVDVNSAPASDIHLWMPGCEGQSSSLHPEFVSKLDPFSVLRFMDWGPTNGSTQQYWSDRKPVDYATYSSCEYFTSNAGVPYEVMIELCNEVHADMWVCVPHMADDNYVTNLAQ
ncbi:MAG: hypothetical protein GTN78_26310, partial [Gemmatimonadales bacterium]|nr:hypothetical protein [Gemmatimonadales bacterium]